MEVDIACFCKKKIIIIKLLYLKLSICVCIKNVSPFAVCISMRRINCYVICLLNYPCHFIWEETYISNFNSFPAISVFMYTNV